MSPTMHKHMANYNGVKLCVQIVTAETMQTYDL